MPVYIDDRLPFTFEYPENYRVVKPTDTRLPTVKFVRKDVTYWPFFLHLTWQKASRRFI